MDVEALREALMQVMVLVDGKTDDHNKKIAALARNALVTNSSAQLRDSVYLHVKRGSCYTVESVIEIQASSGPLHEGDLAVVYRSLDSNAGYGRKLVEFNDGRFARIEKGSDGHEHE